MASLPHEVEVALNQQLIREFEAQSVYLGLAIYCEKELFKGFAAWFYKQSAEERDHAMKIVQYILDRDGTPVIPATPAPAIEYPSMLEAFKTALTHEQANTAGIYACLSAAQKANDPATVQMLQWFVEEQVEEERWASEYVQMVQKIQDSIGGMYQFDHRVGKAAKGE